MKIPIESQRLKQVRKELGMTQSAFAQMLEIGSTSADIERGRTKISGSIVMKLLRDHHINPLWLFGESPQKKLNPNAKDVSPKVISLDPLGDENILMVHAKASAGYADNLGDPEYVENLPAFSLPLPEYRHASFRGFQVEGDSMTPAINPGEWILTKSIEDLAELKKDKIYVLVEDEGIRVKKIQKDADRQQLILHSINPDYPPTTVPYKRIKEIWQYHSKLTTEIDSITSSNDTQETLKALREDINEIKKKFLNQS